jgi:DNA polymerase-3 subunit delta
VKATAPQIRAAMDAPKPETRLYLLHGPDEAGAAELAARLARAIGPDVERVDIEAKELRSNPGRLADEAASMSLFGGARLIRVMAADEFTVEAFSLLLSAERAGNPVVAIGPGLKTSGKLVKLAIASSAAMAHACYVPEGAGAVQLVQMIGREHGLRIPTDVAQRLAQASNADRAILSREIEKLALYLDAAPDRPRDADARALDEIGADIGEDGMFGAIEAIIDGRTADIGSELTAASEGMGSAIPLLRSLARRLVTLSELRSEVEAGSSIDDVIEKHRVFFKERGSTARALRRWNATQLARAIERTRQAERSMMSAASAGEVLADAECVALTRAAARFRN